jgi:hypothetical protein
VDEPEEPLSALIGIRDAFSCNPRFRTLTQQFIFLQGQFFIAVAFTFVSVTLVLREIMKVKASGMQVSKSNSKFADVQGVKQVVALYRKMVVQKAEKLVLMGFMTATLAILNLYVTLAAAPVLENFQMEIEEWTACTTEFRTFCSTYRACRAFPDFQCNSHSDCFNFEQFEYCTDQNVCAECFECALNNDGLGGTCPEGKCGQSSLMDPQETCAFFNCADEIAAWSATSQSRAGITFADVLAGKVDCELTDCSDAMKEMTACVAACDCPAAATTCTDPHKDLPGCACLTSRSPGVTGDVTTGLTEVEVGCHEQLILQLTGQSGYEGNVCLVEDPEKCADSIALFDANSWNPTDFKFRDQCCHESDPFPRVEEICGFQPDDAPSVAFLAFGFFALGSIPLIPGLVFGRAAQFKKAFQTVSRKSGITSLRSSSKVGLRFLFCFSFLVLLSVSYFYSYFHSFFFFFFSSFLLFFFIFFIFFIFLSFLSFLSFFVFLSFYLLLCSSVYLFIFLSFLFDRLIFLFFYLLVLSSSYLLIFLSSCLRLFLAS